MENWTKISKEEMQKGYTLVNLKKGELQILLAKALVREDKLREYIEELKKEKWQNDRTDYMLGISYVGIKVLQILNKGSDK